MSSYTLAHEILVVKINRKLLKVIFRAYFNFADQVGAEVGICATNRNLLISKLDSKRWQHLLY